MNITVLGAGGFIGSHVIEQLIAHSDHPLVGIDVSGDKLAGITGTQFEFVEADIHAVDESIYARTDVVIDLIAYANPSIYVERPLDVFRTNFEANILVLESCIKHQCRLLQYSTSEVYGKAFDPQGSYGEDRTDLVYGPISKQRWIYAATKQLLERVIHAHGLRGDLQYSIIRPFNFLGPRFDYLVPAGATGGPRAFAHFLSALLTGGPLLLVDGGDRRRSFTDIRDATSGLQAIIEAGDAANGEIFNIGNPANDVSIREFAELMRTVYADLTGLPADNEVRAISGDEFYGEGYEDMSRQPPEISKLLALGWQPRHSLRETLEWSIGAYVQEAAIGQKTVR